MSEEHAFLRSAAVTSVLDATLLANASAKIGRTLALEAKPIAELSQLTERLGEFLRFVTLAQAALVDYQPDNASFLVGVQRTVLTACDRIQDCLEKEDLASVSVELDWIAAILGDYPNVGGQIAMALREKSAA
jgi:hypothetical protein